MSLNWAWVMVFVCVLLSTAADALSTHYWKKPSWPLGLTIAVLSPCVFFAFGYAGHKFGLSVASSLTNSLIVIGPILVGLVVFAEWEKMTIPLALGMALIVIGITVIVLCRRDAP